MSVPTNEYQKLKTEPTSSKYPTAIFLIIATEFCERFSFCGLRTILSLYLRNVLLFSEYTSIIIFHIFIMTCYSVPILGAILADSFLGRFSTILYFSGVYALGNIILSLGAATPLHLPQVSSTVFGLLLIAIGTGGIKPCVAAFGGDQFKMPQQQELLQKFFSLFYFTINFGGFVGMVVTPLLRKAFHCFGEESCYLGAFGFPACLMVASLLLFIGGKPWYRIRSPKENIIVQFVKCSAYALIERIHSKEIPKKAHWLEYASDKFDSKLIQDMKNVLAILFLYIPLPLFWSLFDQQGSSWTFQASRTDNELFGVEIMPDQVQVINPAIVLLLIPFFDKSVYPCLNRINILRSPLQRMVVGGLIAASSFVVSGVLELKLQETSPILPGVRQSHLNFVNLLPCDLRLENPFNEEQIVKAKQNYIFQNVFGNNATRYTVSVSSPFLCGDTKIDYPWTSIKIVPHERRVEAFMMTSFNRRLGVIKIRPESLAKSLSGQPKLRYLSQNRNEVVIITDWEGKGKIRFTLQKKKGRKLSYDNNFSPVYVSPYVHLGPGKYNYTVEVMNDGNKTKGNLQLNMGGVYEMIIKGEKNMIDFEKLYIMTPANSVHVLWLIPQYILISVGEVMFAIAGLQFSFTQAPKSMKTVTIAAWYLSVAVGNLIVIVLTQMNLFNNNQAYEFFLYAALVFIGMLLFFVMTTKYKFVGIEADESSSLQLRDSAVHLNTVDLKDP